MPEVCRLKVFTDEHDKQTQQPRGVRSSFPWSHFHEKPCVIPWQKGLISRCAVGSLTAMTLPDTGVAYILLRARVSVGVCLRLEGYGKKLSAPGRVAVHSSKDRPCTAKFGVISFSQVLEAVWSRGCTGGSSAALSKLSNKQERPTGRLRRRKSVPL